MVSSVARSVSEALGDSLSSRAVEGMRAIRVVDFSTGIAGHYCTKLLADAGAELEGLS
jgi:hypothetical protein